MRSRIRIWVITLTIEELANALYPNKAIYNLKESATLLGVSPQTVYNNKSTYPLGRRNTIERIKTIAEQRTRRHPAKAHTNVIGERSR